MSAFWIALALKATLWSAAFGLAVVAVPAQHPRLRRALALLGLWGLWLLPCLPMFSSGSATGGLPLIPAAVVAEHSAWQRLTAALWISVSLVLLVRLLCEAAGIRRLLREAAPSGLPSCAGREVRFSAAVPGPCLAGWWRPSVLLPLEAAAWPAATLHAALRHEGQHARQHDGLHRACAALLRALFWWNPAVHALCGCYEAESEVCCDLEASATGVSRREYGEMLLAHATLGTRVQSLALSFARRSGLRGRIARLLERRQPSRWRNGLRGLLAAALIVSAGLAVAAVRLAPPVLADTAAGLKAEARLRLRADPFPGSR